MKKPKILISLCIMSSIAGLIVFGNSLQNYNNADAVADYVKPIIRNKCGDDDYLCMRKQIGSALDNARENIRYRERVESAATKNMLLGAIMILAGIFGAYYFNNIYIKEEK